ncbi:MAG TPA: helix-turn-helix domain-containing protein [Steroidobacteraceae bacterium]|jgi:excisionase family DNA binding protein|nr:helix-turn-helix domain-containing protein [Steroidobacteraceae bacterium]
MPSASTPTPRLLTIEQVAQILKLHVRTVRNYVRSGSLKATRIGKQYRIGLADLESFTGRPLSGPDERVLSEGTQVDIATVITLEGVSAELAARITSLLLATAGVLRSIEQPVSVSTSYEEPQSRMRVLMAADLKGSSDLLSLIRAVLERPAPAAPA